VPDSDPSNMLFAEFIDDYFVECDEHLTSARSSSLALEAFVNQPHVDSSLLDELFRNFHSVKGLSAMVGVREAEQLAHHLESYLSALQKKQTRLNAEGAETLITGVKTLEQVIVARRGQTPPPNIGPLLAKLDALLPGLPEQEPASAISSLPPASDGRSFELTPEKSRLLAAALASGARGFCFTFVPSAALAERGVNVNTVRQRLNEAGELILGAPCILAGEQIAFAFLVASKADEKTFVPWEEDGLTCTPYEIQPEAAPVVRNGTPPTAPPVGLSTSLMPMNVVRVDLARLDELMRMVGEMVISRARLDDNLKRLSAAIPAADRRTLQETSQALERQLRDLREGVMRVRLVPIREVFARMQFVIRDLTRESGKKVTLHLSGQDTEIDKFVVERIMDPLLHLVRNAISHGLETPAERQASGKPAEGQIFLRASTTGETILIEVEDDGQGINAEVVFTRAQAAGLIGAEAVRDTVTLLDLICAPGFSTRDEADRASGRGVGMAVVRTAVEELGGTLDLTTHLGQGARFTIQLPLTLAIADALIVTVGGHTFAVPQVAVREVMQIDQASLKVLENNKLIPYREGVLPLLSLAAFFRLAEPAGRTFYCLVIGSGLGAVGIVVDRVLGLHEVVVRPLTDPLIRVPGITGATELGDGRVVLILDTMTLTRAARKKARGEKARPGTGMSAAVPSGRLSRQEVDRG
jgi:two-component system, chemotaxis family, sensor kinase CheA